MSTDQRVVVPPAAAPKSAEPTMLAAGLKSSWQRFKAGQLLSYRLMAVLLLVAAGLGLWWYVSYQRRTSDSALNSELEKLSSVAQFEAFVAAHPNTRQATYARLQVARANLTRFGIQELTAARVYQAAGTKEAPVVKKEAVAAQKTAATKIAEARDAFEQLADAFKGDVVLLAECHLGMAKAEAALVGVAKDPDAAGPKEYVGSVEKLTAYLDKLAESAADLPWGVQAGKLSATLKTAGSRDQWVNAQRLLYELPTPRTPDPKMNDPLSPGDFPGGGLPPLGGIPGGTRPKAADVPPRPAGLDMTPKTPEPAPPAKTPDPAAPKLPDIPKAPDVPKAADTAPAPKAPDVPKAPDGPPPPKK